MNPTLAIASGTISSRIRTPAGILPGRGTAALQAYNPATEVYGAVGLVNVLNPFGAAIHEGTVLVLSPVDGAHYQIISADC